MEIGWPHCLFRVIYEPQHDGRDGQAKTGKARESGSMSATVGESPEESQQGFLARPTAKCGGNPRWLECSSPALPAKKAAPSLGLVPLHILRQPHPSLWPPHTRSAATPLPAVGRKRFADLHRSARWTHPLSRWRRALRGPRTSLQRLYRQ